MNWTAIKVNWRVGLITVILIINAIILYFKDKTEMPIESINIILTISYLALEGYERWSTNIDILDIGIGVKNIQEDTHNIKQFVQKYDDEIDKYKDIKQKRHDETGLLSKLINENLISVNTVEAQIPDKKFIAVLCYQKGFAKSKPEELFYKRKYFKLFENVGLVRIAFPWSFFIIAEDNIYPKLRNIDFLGKYLLNKARVILDNEWAEILELSKKEGYTDFYNEASKKDNPLNFNMLIVKTNMRQMRHRFLKTNDFHDNFGSELASLTKAKKLKISDMEKVKIKNFLLQSSLNVLILGLPKADKEKLLSLEGIFKKSEDKGGLSITNFYDYCKRNKTDIKNILLNKFNQEEAEIYTEILFSNSLKYQDLFLELGVYE